MADTLKKSGVVYLVGAGSGDPGMLTLRGAECLNRADVVIYDYLVNQRLLDYAQTSASLVCVGRHGAANHGGQRLMSQNEINSLMVEHAQAGRIVVRLKGGDPGVFARLAEEIAALDMAGLRVEIVPGITAALAASSHAGIPLTSGEDASAVALVTGQEREGKVSSIDFYALAAFPGTLVFYMSVTTARHWTAALIAAGKSPETPAAIVRRCSWPDQITIRCTLGEVAETIESRRLRPPVIVLVGAVVRPSAALNWFESRPLSGNCVLVTRPIEQADSLCTELSELGAEVLQQPAILIGPPADWSPVDAAINMLGEFDWVVFSSANGVRALLNRMVANGLDARAFGKARLAAIGPGTADALAQFHLRADLIPDEFRAEAIAASLKPRSAGKRCLLIRASRGREVLAEELAAAGAEVRQVVAYSSTDVTELRPGVAAALDANQVDWITITSSAIARSLAAMLGERLRQCKLASISPITSATIVELGFAPAAEASVYTMHGVVTAILEFDRMAGEPAR